MRRLTLMAELIRCYPVAVFYVALLATSWPLQIIGGPVFTVLVALAGPSAWAFVMTFVIAGRPGVAALWGRVLRWRVPGRLYLVAIGVGAIVFGAAYGVTALFFPANLSLPPWSATAPVLVNFAVIFVLAGLGEEFGWRGYVLPPLQERYGPFRASLVVGLLWFGWHIPLVISGNSVWVPVFVAFLFGMLGDSMIYTWLFNRSGGSILLVALMHAAGNTWGGHLYQHTFVFDPPGPQFFDLLRQTTYLLLGAVLVVGTRGRLGRSDRIPWLQNSEAQPN